MVTVAYSPSFFSSSSRPFLPLSNQWLCAIKGLDLLLRQGWNPEGTDVHTGQVSSAPVFSGFAHSACRLHYGLYSEHRMQAPHQTGEHCSVWGVRLYWPVFHHHWGELTDCAPLQDTLLQGLSGSRDATSAPQRNLGGGLDPSLHPDGVLQYLWRYWHVSV